MTLHLGRGAAPPAAVVGAQDWIVVRDAAGWRLDGHGDPPAEPGPIDHATIARLVAAADRVVTW